MKDDLEAPAACEMIEHLAFSTGPGIGARARIGLVVLASDHTIEHEFRRVFNVPGFGPGVDFHAARIRHPPQITPATLAALGPLLTDPVDLLLPAAYLAPAAFACRSARLRPAGAHTRCGSGVGQTEPFPRRIRPRSGRPGPFHCRLHPRS